MSQIEDFFIASNSVKSIQEESYDKIQPLIQAVEASGRLSYQSVYLIDYFKQNFLYVSENPLFLCGYTAKEVKEMGYGFYIKNVPEEDQSMLVELNRAGFNFYESVDTADKFKFSMSYDFHLLNKGKKILINHKITPVLLNDEGRIWIAMCVVSMSSRKTSGHIELHINDSPKYWNYSLETHSWKENDGIELKEEEKDVLRLSAEGLTMNEISDKMCKSVDSVKFYRRNIFEKLHVSNITEALAYTTVYKLI
jgi:DNA-binding CsgD family transcriptional regulator